MTFDVDAALTLPSGLVLDRRFFYDDIDRAARAMTLTVQQNVTLYKSNPFYVQNRPSLAFHNVNLVESYLADPRVVAWIAALDARKAGNNVARAVVPMLLSSDDGETLFEPQSYSQKINPRLPMVDIKKYETHTAIYAYHIAQCFAIKGECDAGVEKLTALQGEFAHFDDEAVAAESGPLRYKNFMNDTLSRASKRLEDLSATAMAGLTRAQIDAVNINNVKYFTQYRECENPDTRNASVAGLVTKIFDKNCPLYVRHDHEKKPGDPDLPLLHEGSIKWRKTTKRSLEFLTPLHRLVAGTDMAVAYQIAADMAYERTMDYTMRQMPVLALTDAGAATEPHENAPAQTFKEFITQRYHMLTDRRDNCGIHPLQDTQFMSHVEFAAKLLTESQRGERPDPHMLTNTYDYTRRDGYRGQYNRNLDYIRSGMPIQRLYMQ